MQPFDDGYLAKRERQIRSRFMLRGIARTSALIAIISTILLLPAQGFYDLTVGLLSTAILMWIIAAFSWTISRAQTEAEKAIQAEQERLFKLYGLASEKPKRDMAVRLSEDGELTADLDVPFEEERSHDSVS
jgi:hypothetical protein